MSEMDQLPGNRPESPETITKRIQGHIVRSALDEEIRAQKALTLLKARDKKIAALERRILEFERAGSSGDETRYLSLPSSASVSPRHEDEVVADDLDTSGASIGPKAPTCPKSLTNVAESVSVPRLKFSTTSVSNSEVKGDSKVTGRDLNDLNDSSLASEDFRPAESSVDLVVTAALAFSKFDDELKTKNQEASGEGRVKVKGMPSTSPTWMKTRRGAGRHSKRGTRRRNEKSRVNSCALGRNLREVQEGLDSLLRRTEKNSRGNFSGLIPEKQKVEDRVAREDAQEAAATPGSSTDQANFYSPPVKQFSADTPLVIQGSAVDNPFWRDEPAPQWLIEEALNRGPKINPEIIISDLEKKLRSARAELADALNEQLLIKNKYKKALKNLKISADEERDEMQRKIVKICTSIFEKCTKKIRCHKKHQKPLQHFGKLSKQLHKKLRIASLTSAKLKREVLSAKQDLQEKSRQYDSLAKNFENLKFELKNAEININELRKENESLRKGIEDTREWMQTRVSKERHEKINSAQFREIQRSRELTNLKKKSEEDISTIVQLRSKLLRLESANSNKGFLITNYKSQLVDLNSEKDKLLSKIKELENENSQLRNNNAQLKASVTLISDEKEKMHSEKSESEIIERMQSKLATKYERSMLQRVDAMKTKYEKIVVSLQDKLRASENSVSQYFEAIKRFLKNIHEHHRQLDTERDLSCSEASEREAHETACSILNITPFELTGFLNGNPLKTVNSWLTEVQKLTSRKNFAEDLGKFLFARAIGSDRSKSII